MYENLYRKFTVAAIAAAAVIASTASSHAALVAVVSVDGGSFATLGSASGPFPAFNFLSTVSGISLQGGAFSNEPGTASFASLFDASVQVTNTTGAAHGVRLVVTDDAITSPVGLVSVTSHASGSSPFGGVSLNAFTSYVNGTPIIHSGLPLALLSNVSYSDNQSILASISSDPYSISQDFSFTLQAGDTFDFSNSIGVSEYIAPAPEPATGAFGMLLLMVGAGARRRAAALG